MESEYLYNVSVTWDMERIGTMRSTVFDSVIEVATPPEFAKNVGGDLVARTFVGCNC